MSYFIFDLDGTLANIDHRLHYLDNNDWDGFFEACDKDEPVKDVIKIFIDLVEAGHKVEIWSGRSASVAEKTCQWLDTHINSGRFYDAFGGIGGDIWHPPSDHLKHMRPENDRRSDTVLKEEWLNAFHQEHGFMPTMIFDDRQSVVDMWRKNGVTCAQVASWKDRKYVIEPHIKGVPQLFLMVGPSGAGKSRHVSETFKPTEVVSSDEIREELCGNFKDQTRNKDVFQAVENLVEARLKSGLRVVVDATNLRAKDRKKYIKIANEVDPNIKICYIVVDRPLEEKHRDAGWRANVTVKGDVPLIDYHHNIFQQNLKQILNGDGIEGILVRDERK